MTTLKSAVQQAIKMLESGVVLDRADAAVSILRIGLEAEQSQQVAAPDGNWLWCKLMDFCKKRGYAPAVFDDLFAIVGEARAQQVAVPMSDSEIETLREKTFSTDNPYCPVDSKSMRKAVRATESHYGIVSK